MQTTTIVSMTLICGVVWGGFLLLAWRALRSEQRRRSSEAESP